MKALRNEKSVMIMMAEILFFLSGRNPLTRYVDLILLALLWYKG